MGYQNVSDSILCCILSDLTFGSDSGLRVLSTVCPCTDRWSSPWGAYKLRRPGGTNSHVMVKGSVVRKYKKKSCQNYRPRLFLESQPCFFFLPTKGINPNQRFHEPQLFGPQTLKETDVFHEVWGFVTGDFHGFNTQIYTCSSNYKG